LNRATNPTIQFHFNKVDFGYGIATNNFITGYFNGLIDDIRVYQKVLTKKEIACLVNK
jgi:hypothetical protein